MEQGMDVEWFTEDSGVVITSTTATPTTGFAAAFEVDNTPTLQTDAGITLFKVGPHVLLGQLLATQVDLVYDFKHSLGSSNHRFNAASAIAVEQTPISSTALVAVGDTSIMLGSAPLGIDVGDAFFFENQFYKVKSLIAPVSPATDWAIELDRPFGGTATDGGDAATADLYKVTLPANGFGYQYVSPCSGRGLCNTETGVCTCFKGYTNDNCDTQNILAL